MTNSQFDMLEFAEHMQKYHGPHTGIRTGRTQRRCVAERCVRRGWLSRHMAYDIDDDGFLAEPERWRQGYILTDKGKAALADERARREAAAKGGGR